MQESEGAGFAGTLSEKCEHFSEDSSPTARLPFGKALAGREVKKVTHLSSLFSHLTEFRHQRCRNSGEAFRDGPVVF